MTERAIVIGRHQDWEVNVDGKTIAPGFGDMLAAYAYAAGFNTALRMAGEQLTLCAAKNNLVGKMLQVAPFVGGWQLEVTSDKGIEVFQFENREQPEKIVKSVNDALNRALELATVDARE